MGSFREGYPELRLAPGMTNGIIKVINNITYNINIIIIFMSIYEY